MPLLIDEPLDFLGWHNFPSRCRIRIFTPPSESQEANYVVMLVDDGEACGISVTNAAEQIAALACGRYHVPPERAQFIECYDYRHTATGHDGNGHQLSFARIKFSVPTAAGEVFDFVHGCSLGKPQWSHIDRDSLETLIGEPLY